MAPAALTIVVQSWMTPIVGALMLALGRAAGLWLRSGGPGASPAATAGSAAESTATANPTQNVSAARLAFMNTLIAQTRHFQGEASAPVTLIEFSDFQ